VVRLTAGPILTDDLWWHLAMGRAYAANGPWLAADPLLHTAHASGPVPHEWLFGVVVHAIERVGGFSALRIAHTLAVLGIAALVWSTLRRTARSAELAALATIVFLVLAWWRLMQARPDLVSIAATLVLYRLLVLRDDTPGWREGLGFVLLMTLWANLHSLFAIAFPLGLAACLGLAARGWAGRRLGAEAAAFSGDLPRAVRLAAVLAVGGVASLLNPRGIGQHLTFFTSSSGAAIWQVRDEWRAFDPFRFTPEHESLGPLEWATADALLWSFALASIAGAIAFARRPSAQRLRAVDPVVYALGCAAAIAMLISVRFLWLGVLPLAALLTTARERGLAMRLRTPASALAIALALAFPLASSWWVVRSTQPSSWRDLVCTPYLGHKYGVPGVAFLRDAGIEGRLFNAYGAGGFLGYWLAPGLRTFIDGRTEHYAPEVLEDYLAVVNRNPTAARGMDEILDDRGVDVFFGFGFPNELPRHELRHTAGHLLGDDSWVPVSRSVLHTIWLRRTDRANLDRVARWYAERGVPFDRERGLEMARVLAESAPRAIEEGWVPREYAELDAAWRSGHASALELRRLAIVLALLGAHERQLEVDFAYEDVHGADLGSQRRIVYALLRLGLSDEAWELAELLPALAPDDPRAEVVAKVARQHAFYEVRRALQDDVPLPVRGLDRYPLLDPADQQWILDGQRTLTVAGVRSRATAP
jgi:hypothetical protein